MTKKDRVQIVENAINEYLDAKRSGDANAIKTAINGILNIQNPADAFLDSGRFQLSGLNLEKVRAVKISSSILLDFFNQPVVGLVFLDKSNLDLFAKVTQRFFFSHYFTSGYWFLRISVI